MPFPSPTRAPAPALAPAPVCWTAAEGGCSVVGDGVRGHAWSQPSADQLATMGLAPSPGAATPRARDAVANAAGEAAAPALSLLQRVDVTEDLHCHAVNTRTRTNHLASLDRVNLLAAEWCMEVRRAAADDKSTSLAADARQRTPTATTAAPPPLIVLTTCDD